ncbi:MAG: threonine/serine exporter family protein [Clostridia bacterium]|nr:threonine/serine exporter family protein [Clostridia bacterium]
MNHLITFIGAVIGTLGFSLMFKISRKQLPWAILGGAVTFVFYLLFLNFGCFVANMMAGVAMMGYCEIVARIRKAPVTVFLSAALVVLVPGGALYYTIYNVLSKNTDMVINYGATTAITCLGIIAGISIATVIINAIFLIFNIKRK